MSNIKFTADSHLSPCEFVVLKRFGGNERQILCGCGVTFFSDYCDEEVRCPSCFKEDKLLQSIEELAKFAIESNKEKELAKIILVMSEALQEYDLSCADEFPYLSKYWGKIGIPTYSGEDDE